MSGIFAVKPGVGGSVVHLAMPGYEPGKKRRSIRDHASLCNVGVSGQAKVPLAEALRWPKPDGPTAVQPAKHWTLCRVCVGHAVAIAGMSHEVLVTVSARGVDS